MTIEAFGVLLRRHRLAAGLSQEALAERASLSVRGLSDLERGVRTAPYPATVARLADALDLSTGDRAILVAASRQDDQSPAQPEPARSDPPSAPAPGLPVPLSSFVGREAALAELRGLLEGARLLSLTGAGGVGKTRLALQVARTASDPSWVPIFVELAPVLEDAAVPQAVAAVVSVQESGGRPLLASIAEAIGPRAILLVLDNCEHLIEASAELADHLLQRCPRLRILTTSREPLGLAGEAIWRVPSLAVPAGEPDLDDLQQFEAVRLFVERARLVVPSFALTERNTGAVAQICRRLDGVPLAIELAAARMAVLSADQIAARLDDRFALLSGGGRSLPARQRTLRETVEWSYDLLDDAERALFDRLSVFAGGWSLEAVEAMVGEQAGPTSAEGTGSAATGGVAP